MTGRAGHCRYEEDGFAAAYALGLLEGAELAEYAAHLVMCPICPTEVAAYLAASSDLALADDDTPDLAPTPDARARLLAAAVAEREARATTNTVPLSAVVPRRRRIPRLVPLALAAALVLFIGAGLLLRLLVPGAGAPSPEPAPVVFSFGTSGGAMGQATYRADQRLLRLSFQGLPPLNPEQVYQLWLLGAEGPESSQVFRLTDGAGTTSVTVDLAPYRALYVTIEPAPDGSRAPTSTAIVAAGLPGSAGSAGGAVPPLPCATAVPACDAPQPVAGIATRTASATPPGTTPPIRTPIDRVPPTRTATPVDPAPTTSPSVAPQASPPPNPRGTPAPTTSPSVAPQASPPPNPRGTPAPSPVPSPTAAPPVAPAATSTLTPAPTAAVPVPPTPTPSPPGTPGTLAPVPSPTESQPTPSPPAPPPVPSASAPPAAPPPTASPPAPSPPAVPTTQPAPPPTPTLLPRPAPSSPPEPPPGRSGTPVRP